jgi:16S rRNA G966 N2-methylase RsmD
MNNRLLAPEVQAYISENLNADVNKIALAKSPFEDISATELAAQIMAKKKAEKKLPTWFNTDGIYYPSTLSIEQTSSEVAAQYKSKLAKGNTLIDLTGGFGVDSYYFSRQIQAVTHCEINSALSQIAQNNAKALAVDNVSFFSGDGLTYLKQAEERFDTIYLDPARRAEKGKVFMLKDCTPDVVSNLDLLLAKSDRIIIKTAPLLDITAGLLELKNVTEIHIVSIKNECKEILWVVEANADALPKIIAVTINETQKAFSFLKSENDTSASYTNNVSTGDYLFEPDAALLKSGAFNLIGNKYHLEKLHPQTQLYTSKNLNPLFPGRIFKVEEIYSTNDLKKLKLINGNVIVRNYPAKPEDLVKKYKIKADKEQFLIFTKALNGDHIILRSTILQYY